jgi:hypothetical protein
MVIIRLALASCASGCLTIIIIQHSAQPLTALDRSTATGARLLLHDQPVAQPLMVALVMIMHDEFLNGPSQRAFSEQDHLLQTGFFDGPDKAFGVGIQGRKSRALMLDWDSAVRRGSRGFEVPGLFLQRVPVSTFC